MHLSCDVQNFKDNRGMFSSCPPRELDIMLPSAIFNCQGSEIPDFEVNTEEVAWVILNEQEHAKYNGLGRFGGCSGTLIEPATIVDSSPAYIITNGHCIGIKMSPTGSIFDLELDKTMIFKYYLTI